LAFLHLDGIPVGTTDGLENTLPTSLYFYNFTVTTQSFAL
jgi:hypothetical protein